MDKVLFISFLRRFFLLIWGDEICGPERENFLLSFSLSLFSFLFQIVKNTVFHSIFHSIFSILPKIISTKYSVNLFILKLIGILSKKEKAYIFFFLILSKNL